MDGLEIKFEVSVNQDESQAQAPAEQGDLL